MWIKRKGLFEEGDIGGGGTQYRNTVRKICKYRVENLWNTDNAFMIGYSYLKLYPSRVFVYLTHLKKASNLSPCHFFDFYWHSLFIT